MEIISDPQSSFTLAGILLISSDVPSFGTPVFKDSENYQNYIQSSKDETQIDSFYQIREICEKSELFRSLRLNEAFCINNPFLIGFIDIKMEAHVLTKLDLLKKVTKEFELYENFPFLQWTMIYMFSSEKLLNRLSDENLALLCSTLAENFKLSDYESVIKLYSSGKAKLTSEMFKGVTIRDVRDIKINIENIHTEKNTILSANLRNKILHSNKGVFEMSVGSETLKVIRSSSGTDLRRLRSRYRGLLRQVLKERVASHRDESWIESF